MTEPIDRITAALADHYRIERELGQGGMATVYLAEDLRHERRVAIKVLRPELSAIIGVERFVREIKTVAALQHPHILGLIDSGEVSGTAYYVMPYVEGDSLRDRLQRERQLPIADAVRIANEVASALDYAHRHGVIHRDIKPENILLHEGQALVADFGIALAVSRSDGGTRLTETGMSLGTPHYMSPEQAMGEREITARTDIYALGCVLYEMLVGEPPFSGPSAQAIVAKVMTERPTRPSATRDTVPEVVEEAVLIALAKLPVDRFATAAEFAGALGGRATGTRSTARGAAAPASPGPYRRLSLLLGATTLALGALAAWALLRHPAATGPSVYDLGLPDSAQMFFSGQTPSTPYGSPMRNLSLAPDGSFVVYLVQAGTSTMLWRRDLRDGSATAIPGTGGGTLPRLSPDGTRLAFVQTNHVMVLPVRGGPARRLIDVDGQATALMWLEVNRVAVIDNEGYRMRWLDPEGGEIEQRAIPRCVDGAWSASARRLICSLGGLGRVIDPFSGTMQSIRSRGTRDERETMLSGSAFRVVDDRYLVYTSPEGDLRAASYNPTTASIDRSVPLVNGVRRESIGTAQFDINADGTLIYAPGGNAEIGHLVRLGPGGTITPLPVDSGAYMRWDLSRDGRWLATVSQAPGYNELAIHDLKNRQTFVWLRDEVLQQPLWSPDGATILITVRHGNRNAILQGSPFQRTAPDTIAASDTIPLPRVLDFNRPTVAIGSAGALNTVVQFDPTRRPISFDTLAHDRLFGMMSPDARHLVFSASAGSRIVMTSAPPGSWERQVATNAVEPIWLSDSAILYRSGVTWLEARINPATSEVVSTGTVWGSDPRFADTFGWSNRPDWQGGVIYLQGPVRVEAAYLRVVPQWVSQMKRLVDQANQ